MCQAWHSSAGVVLLAECAVCMCSGSGWDGSRWHSCQAGGAAREREAWTAGQAESSGEEGRLTGLLTYLLSLWVILFEINQEMNFFPTSNCCVTIYSSSTVDSGLYFMWGSNWRNLRCRKHDVQPYASFDKVCISQSYEDSVVKFSMSSSVLTRNVWWKLHENQKSEATALVDFTWNGPC